MTNIGDRKDDHLELCARSEVGFRETRTLLDDVRFVHHPLPDLSLDEVDLSCTVLGRDLRAPILIEAMTGGTESTGKINRDLATVAEKLGIGFALGSQRPMLEEPSLASTYEVRGQAPTTLVIGNLGLWQARGLDPEALEEIAKKVGVDAMALHLNVAQELVQPGGDRDFTAGVDTLEELSSQVEVPLVVKETGCGLGPLAGRRLRRAGIDHIDVAGAGGTSWVAVETERASGSSHELGELLREWGVPTAAAVALNSGLGFRTVIASGGIRTGMDVARSIALGATCAGMARPVLQAYMSGGVEAAERYLSGVIDGLRAVMLLTRSHSVEYLREAPRVIVGELSSWLDQLGPGSSGRR